MASGQTSNYGLNQWAAEDKVLREEFNQDNVKIDTAISNVIAAGPKIITGSYAGTGTQEILHYSIGAQPKFLILLTANSDNVGFSTLMVTPSHYLRLQKSGSNQLMTNDYVTFTGDGFTINHSKYSPGMGFNQGTTCYCAFC